MVTRLGRGHVLYKLEEKRIVETGQAPDGRIVT